MRPSNLPRSPLGRISEAAAMQGHGEAAQPPLKPLPSWSGHSEHTPSQSRPQAARPRSVPLPVPTAELPSRAGEVPSQRVSPRPPRCALLLLLGVPGRRGALHSSRARPAGRPQPPAPLAWLPPPPAPTGAPQGGEGWTGVPAFLSMQLPPQEPLPMEAGGEVAQG